MQRLRTVATVVLDRGEPTNPTARLTNPTEPLDSLTFLACMTAHYSTALSQRLHYLGT
jgi:hypothetical protein